MKTKSSASHISMSMVLGAHLKGFSLPQREISISLVTLKSSLGSDGPFTTTAAFRNVASAPQQAGYSLNLDTLKMG